ncbi:MAG: hypothetical protein LBV27_10320 [Oscillospiraceae bacterium]|jgi:hypothetical protein|nr:hypothetical protein [Oscillospiraceae bacterium]
MEQYMLEVTMESRDEGKHRYIRRSFPVSKDGERIIEISRYGYPYSAIGSLRPYELNEEEGTIRVPLKGNDYLVHLNSFTTVKWDDGYVASPWQQPGVGYVPGTKEVTVTFYLYIE